MLRLLSWHINSHLIKYWGLLVTVLKINVNTCWMKHNNIKDYLATNDVFVQQHISTSSITFFPSNFFWLPKYFVFEQNILNNPSYII